MRYLCIASFSTLHTFPVKCSSKDSTLFINKFLSNEERYSKIHYDTDILAEDRALLPRYNSDVCKWHRFISNLTEDVFQVPKDTFTMDYARTLKSQTVSLKIPKAFLFPLRTEILINFLTLDLKSALPMLWNNSIWTVKTQTQTIYRYLGR